jgi:hypothetical protein
MPQSPRTLCASLGLLLVASVFAERPALAQDTTSPEPERFCSDHWLAMGRCRERDWTGPEILFGMDLGVSAMNESGPFGFGNGVGAVTNAGPAWGLRAGIELVPWLALEARYVGMYNSAQASVGPAGGVGFLTTGGEAVVRLTAPLPFVHPYVFGGVGYYDNALVGSVGSELNSSSEAGVPMGFGLEVPLTWHFSLGAEATYHFLLHESFSSVTTNGIDGGDLSTFNAVLRLRL